MSSLVPRLRKVMTWRALDVALAAFMTVAAIVSLALTDQEPPGRDATWVAYVLAGAAMVSLAWRRQHPVAVLAVSLGATVALVVAGYAEAGTPIAVLIAFYSVATGNGRRSRWLGAAALALAFLVMLVFNDRSDFSQGDVAGNAVAFTIVWAVGEHQRARRERLAFAEERADRLEREHDERERRAVAEERLRIAQDLHDVVAHAMSVITVQAGVGAHVIDARPDEARKALAAIETTGRAALQELRVMVGVLRQEDDPRAPRTPAPGLDDIGTLVERVRTAGVPVHLHVEGDVATVPASVSRSGYRVVQESLTNVLKHAGRASVDLSVLVDPGCATIRVVDDGRGAASRFDGHAEGFGLRGMRERVELFGGTLEAGPQGGGGFAVVARLPFVEGGDDRIATPAVGRSSGGPP